jgi:uncharacterized DUF497 family protein
MWTGSSTARNAGTTIGLAGGIALLLVVHTIGEEDGEETCRIISARKASPRERGLCEFNE